MINQIKVINSLKKYEMKKDFENYSEAEIHQKKRMKIRGGICRVFRAVEGFIEGKLTSS